MTVMQILPGLSEVAGDYDAILCDVWGVVHNGRKSFAGAVDALENFRKGGGKVVLITNAPVPRADVERYFEPLGVRRECYDTLVSSGDTTRAWLEAHQGATVLAIGIDEGWERDRRLYQGLDLNFTDDPEKADYIVAMGLRDGFNDDPEDYRQELERYFQHGLRMVVPNPDLKVRVGSRLHWCGGSLGKIYSELGGQVILTGKPHPPIYARAMELLAEMGCTPVPRRVLAIGDGPLTDIKGANAQGYDALYVGTGLHDHESGDFAWDARELLAKERVEARFAMPGLGW